jgi:hypothetical protein
MSKATNTDPIYAAIERHRVAEREYGDILTEQGKLEKELPKELRQSNIDVHGKHIVETDDPRWIAIERKSWDACNKTVECSTALVETRPTTLEGLKALLRYATDFLGDDTDVSRGILENAAKAIETVTADEPAEGPVSEPAEERDSNETKFGRAYQELFEARADIQKLNAGGYGSDDDSDDVCDALIDGGGLQLKCVRHRRAAAKDDGRSRMDDFGCDRPFAPGCSHPVIDAHITTVNPAKLSERRAECRDARLLVVVPTP